MTKPLEGILATSLFLEMSHVRVTNLVVQIEHFSYS